MKRIASIDTLRGLIMVIMALDHTRDYVNSSALLFSPDDLSRTTAALFFTRWITHFCAPVFMFTAGLGAFLRLERSGDRRALSRFLWTRGLWLIALEFTVVRFVMFFTVDYNPTFLLVFWVLGIAMIALAALIHLPFRWLAVVSVAMIGLHNLLDTITPARFGGYGWVWNVLHQQGLIHQDPVVIVAYPLIPWIGVMAAGFCFGRIYRLPDDRRRTTLIVTGLALTLAFVVLRYANVYGDPQPWSFQPRPGFTILSFLKATKNPPSLLFLLMTLGPAILFLGLVDRLRFTPTNPLIVFGRTPQFYFIVHLADPPRRHRARTDSLRRPAVSVAALARDRGPAHVPGRLRLEPPRRLSRLARRRVSDVPDLPDSRRREGITERLVAELRLNLVKTRG